MHTLDHGHEEETNNGQRDPLAQVQVPEKHREQSPNLARVDLGEVEVQGAGVLARDFDLEQFARNLDPVDDALQDEEENRGEDEEGHEGLESQGRAEVDFEGVEEGFRARVLGGSW